MNEEKTYIVTAKFKLIGNSTDMDTEKGIIKKLEDELQNLSVTLSGESTDDEYEDMYVGKIINLNIKCLPERHPNER